MASWIYADGCGFESLGFSGGSVLVSPSQVRWACCTTIGCSGTSWVAPLPHRGLVSGAWNQKHVRRLAARWACRPYRQPEPRHSDFSPVVLLAAYGAICAWRSPLPAGNSPGLYPQGSESAFDRADAILLMRYASLAAVAILLTYSKFIAWWGGHGYGPRYFTDAMPFVGFLFAPGLLPLFKGTIKARIGRIAAITLLVYSIFIQLVGAFCWPSPWTLNDPPYRFRLWDWRDSEIEVCIRSGPRIDPAARRLFALLRGA